MNNNEIVNINGPLKGETEIPGDKSITHRAITLASLAKGISTIYEPLMGEGCRHTMDIFKLLGVTTEEQDNSIIISSPGYQNFITPHQVLYTGNSGTTTRLLVGLLNGLGTKSALLGDVSISKRPMGRVTKPLLKMSANISGIDNNYIPLIIKPSTIRGINYQMETAGAQVESAISLASLLLKEATTFTEFDINRDHTEALFAHFDISISIQDRTTQTIPYVIEHIQPRDFHVPRDTSSAAFFIVITLIMPDSDITIRNVGINLTHSGIIDIVKQMGGNIGLSNISKDVEPTASIHVKYISNLNAVAIKGDLVPRATDELPIITLFCTQASDSYIIKNAEELKVKETNRIDTTADILNLSGFNLQSTHDGLIVHPSEFRSNATVDSQTDHRVGMMLAVASLLNSEPLRIEQFDAVNASFPGFLLKLKLLGNERE